jgi:8-oxo-dGTP pyrophosphatase MutT (NUDIX family)
MPAPAQWKTLDETLHADCAVFKVFKNRCQHPHDKREGDFFVVKSPDWVLALALTAGNQLILVRQYRFGTRTLSWEPPGGVLDTGESPVSAACRELREETGYTGKNARIIGTCCPNPAIFNNTAHFVLVEDCVLTDAIALDPNEEIEVRAVAPREAIAMSARGEMHHAIAQAALFHLRTIRPGLF